LIRILSEFATELPEKYLTYNVGFMLAGATATVNDKQNGGTVTGKLNIVPGEGYALGDLRTLSDEQAERAEAKMRAIVAKHLPKTEAEITFRGLMPAMSPERNRGLLKMLNGVNLDLGLSAMEELELDPMKADGQ
jgi:glutamate carboxypeptidase